MAQTYPALQLSKDIPTGSFPARTGETSIVCYGGVVNFAYAPSGAADGNILPADTGWIVPANTAVNFTRISGEPRVTQMDNV